MGTETLLSGWGEYEVTHAGVWAGGMGVMQTVSHGYNIPKAVSLLPHLPWDERAK